MIKVGDTISKRYVFTREKIRFFAEETGDTNPLHHDEARAAASRFGGIIACGAHMSGVLMSLGAAQAAEQQGENVGLDFSFRFRKAIPAGMAATFSWTVTEIEWSDKLKGDLIKSEGYIKDDAGTVYVVGHSKAVLWR
ncbi:MAG: MaoC family dehydratase [Rhodomicrobiaceae bacterium]